MAASLLGAPAEGARRGRGPALILLFQEGYGIIAAEVLEASETQRRYPYRYRVTLLVHEITAQPIKGAAFPLGADQTLAVEVTVGYACMIEDWADGKAEGGGDRATRKGGPLASGRKYFLTVKYDPAAKAYTHAGGASILEPVEEFSAQRKADIRATRAVAALDTAARIQRCLELLAAPDTTQFVRLQALAETRSCLQRGDPAEGPQRRAISAFYRELWRGDTSHLDLRTLYALDYTMRLTLRGPFARSKERSDVWIARLCAPLKGRTDAERHEALKERSHLVPLCVADAGMAHPDHVGAKLMKEMSNVAHPATTHTLLAECLLVLYRRVDDLPSAWDPFLQGYLPRLVDRAGPLSLEQLAPYLQWAVAKPRKHERRAFQPTAELRGALHRARDRLRKLTDADARGALTNLDRALRSLR